MSITRDSMSGQEEDPIRAVNSLINELNSLLDRCLDDDIDIYYELSNIEHDAGRLRNIIRNYKIRHEQ